MHHQTRLRHGASRPVGALGSSQSWHNHYCPIAWTPPSTWIISPVVAGNQSDNSAHTARAVGSASLTSQPKGARPDQLLSISSKPGIDLAAVVRMEPAETTLTRIFSGPKSRAR